MGAPRRSQPLPGIGTHKAVQSHLRVSRLQGVRNHLEFVVAVVVLYILLLKSEQSQNHHPAITLRSHNICNPLMFWEMNRKLSHLISFLHFQHDYKIFP